MNSVCRLCEKEMDALLMRDHLVSCQQIYETKKQLNELDRSIQNLGEKCQKQKRSILTQMSLIKSRSRMNTPDRMKGSAPLRKTSYNNSDEDITSESLVPLKKSRFCTNAITLIQEDPTEKELDQIYEIKRRAPKNMISSPYTQSPMSQQSDQEDQIKLLKKNTKVLGVIENYCNEILKSPGTSIQIDLQTQIELQNQKLYQQDLKDLVKESLHLIEKRILLIQRMKQIKKPEDEDSMQKSMKKSSMSLQFQMSKSWVKKPNTFTEFTQDQPVVTSLFKKCDSEESEDNSPISEEKSPIMSNLGSTNSRKDRVVQISQEQTQEDHMKGYFSDGELKERKYKQKQKQLFGVSLRDFDFLQLLGVGAYGAVWLVKKKQTNDFYAMKVIDCNNKSKQEVENLKAEKNVFELLEGDYVVKAFYSFVQDGYLFFLLEYMEGGDLGYILQEYCALYESVAKIYLAELFLAIESLHKKGIIHRDLKPQNILLDQDGHVKLADFGLSEIALARKIKQTGNEKDKIQADRLPSTASVRQIKTQKTIEFQLKENIQKQVEKKSHKIVGTPDYMPPEVINSESSNNFTIDWWAYGVIAYEMICGIPPFNDETIQKVFHNIQNLNIQWPDIGDGEDQMSQNAYDLIKGLLDPNYITRLGSQPKDIKNHPFFKGIDWDNIRTQDAPIKPIKQDLETQEGDNKKKNAEEKMEILLSKTVNQSQELFNLAEIANLTRIDLLAQLSQKEAENIIRRRSVCLPLF